MELILDFDNMMNLFILLNIIVFSALKWCINNNNNNLTVYSCKQNYLYLQLIPCVVLCNSADFYHLLFPKRMQVCCFHH